MIRTIRQSFRRKKRRPTSENNRPVEWKNDEDAVKNARCSFHVKYLGQVEVQESRGMHVCEEAVKRLKAGKKKKIKAMLYITPDALRVVEDSTKALLLDQTIEKVSFCAPDRNYDKAFSYICRDGTTRRWLCHSFFAIKESGERLSHAVGCAFAACLEKKQKREKEGVSATYDSNRTTFAREGSFRVKTLTEQAEESRALQELSNDSLDSSQVKVEVHSTKAIPRPHAPAHLVRQASMRPLSHKNRFKDGEESLHSPFKRNLSLQLQKLPSTLARCDVMNPVPEAEEENVTTQQFPSFGTNPTGKLTNSHGDDPFAKAPMPKLSAPVISLASNVNNAPPDVILQPIQLHQQQQQQQQVNNNKQTNNTPAALINFGPSSPVHDTNPWAADTQRMATSNFPPAHHQRTASEADEWLKKIEQQVVSGQQHNHIMQKQQSAPAFQFNM